MISDSKYCEIGQFRVAVSKITDRSVLVNVNPDKFQIMEKANFSCLQDIVEAFLCWVSDGGTRTHKLSRPVISAIRSFAEVSNSLNLCMAIDQLIDAVLPIEKTWQGIKSPVLTWLLRLWDEGFLAFPATLPFKSKIKFPWDKFGFPINHEWVMKISNASISKEEHRVPGLALRAAATTIGIRELGDLVPNCVSEHFFEVKRQELSTLVYPVISLQRVIYGDQAIYTPKDWGLGRKSRGHDRTYKWVLERDITLIDWQQKVEAWLKEGRSLALRTYMADRLFACLIEHKSLPRTVEEYCRRTTTLEPTWAEWMQTQNWATGSQLHYTNYFADFIDWFLRRYLTDEDDYGRPVFSPAHFNPVTRISGEMKAAQTHRESLPLRYIHELIGIIQDEDFAWPKTLASDYFMWYDPMSGEFIKTWSPIRAVAMLMKLHLPLRTFQVRMLDSGEADTEVFDGKIWVSNTTALAPKKDIRVRRGFLRKMTDTTTGTEFSGLYVNTNKTADIFRNHKDLGYEIPWEHEKVIRLVVYLIKWQKEFNQIQRPIPWTNLHDKVVLRSNSREMLLKRDDACFLFRDPKSAYPSEPVVDSKLQSFWTILLCELERRVAARGEYLPDNSPIRFVRPIEGTGLPVPLFDLHSLRVALITAYAIEGGVPIQILSKCIAGHATILMTLYYTKPGPAYVSEEMAKAQQRIEQAEQANFIRFLKNVEIREASPLVITNDSAALNALDSNEQSGWVVGDIGICPVGMGKCHVGGKNIDGNKTKNAFVPTPGGAKNCVRCRFFITGPAFLGGLVAKFNSTGVLLMEASERLRKIESEICGIEDRGLPEELRSLGRTYDRRDRVLEEVDTFAYTWHACFALIQRSKIALKAANGDVMSLVLVGDVDDLDVALTECSDFELYNAVCQMAAIYPNDSPVLPTLRRGRLLDAMLSRNGRRPVFATLSEEEALAIGNEFVNLLMARLGRAETVDLIEGRRMMKSTGIEEYIDRLIAEQSYSPVKFAATRINIRPQ